MHLAFLQDAMIAKGRGNAHRLGQYLAYNAVMAHVRATPWSHSFNIIKPQTG
jgi:hypothetical protein